MNEFNYVKGFDLFGVKARQIPCLTGKGEPIESIALKIGLLYINEDNGDMYKCVNGNGEDLVWALVNNESNDSGQNANGAGLTAEFGLSNGTDETAAFQRTVLKNSREKFLLLPGKKVGVDSFIKVCEAERFDVLITDWECVEDEIAALEEKQLTIIVAEEPK